MKSKSERFKLPYALKGMKAKMQGWVKRFLPAEICGSGLAIMASYLMLYFTHNKVAAAYAAATADTMGFYTVITLQSTIALRRHLHNSSQGFSGLHLLQVFKNIFIEFGPAELLDSFLLRPFFMYIFPVLLHNYTVGIITGKIISDVCFYIPVIFISEFKAWHNKRLKKQ